MFQLFQLWLSGERKGGAEIFFGGSFFATDMGSSEYSVSDLHEVTGEDVV